MKSATRYRRRASDRLATVTVVAAVRLALGGLTLAACALGAGCVNPDAMIAPEPQREWKVPQTERYAAVAAAPSEPAHVTATPAPGPPSIEPGKTYELAELIDIAERNNPETQIAWEQARTAALSVGMAESAYAPVLAASATGVYQRVPTPIPTTVAPSGFFVADMEMFLPLLTFKLVIFDFGGRAASVDAAREALAATNFSFNATHQQLVLEVTRAYCALTTAQGDVEAARAALTSAQTVEDAARARHARGLATLPEVLQAREQTARAGYDLQEARTGESDAHLALLGVMGVRPTTPLRIVSLSERPLPATLQDTAEQFVDRALAQRPDLLAQVAEIRAREAEVRKARSEFYPRIAISGNVGENIGRFGVQGVPGWSGVNEPTYGAVLSIEVPLYDGGLRRDQVGQAESQRRIAEKKFDAARDRVEREVVKAYDDLKLAFDKREAATALLEAAENSYSAVVDSYRRGTATFVDISNAQAALTKARTADAQTRSGIFSAAATLAFSTGELARP
jgi:outer membrane protein TolC